MESMQSSVSWNYGCIVFNVIVGVLNVVLVIILGIILFIHMTAPAVCAPGLASLEAGDTCTTNAKSPPWYQPCPACPACNFTEIVCPTNFTCPPAPDCSLTCDCAGACPPAPDCSLTCSACPDCNCPTAPDCNLTCSTCPDCNCAGENCSAACSSTNPCTAPTFIDLTVYAYPNSSNATVHDYGPVCLGGGCNYRKTIEMSYLWNSNNAAFYGFYLNNSFVNGWMTAEAFDNASSEDIIAYQIESLANNVVNNNVFYGEIDTTAPGQHPFDAFNTTDWDDRFSHVCRLWLTPAEQSLYSCRLNEYVHRAPFPPGYLKMDCSYVTKCVLP